MMGRVGVSAVALLCCVAPLVRAEVADVSPTQKVVTMLEDLQTQVIMEGKEEAKGYDKFACFCKDMSEEKTWDIEDAQDLIADLTATDLMHLLDPPRHLCWCSLPRAPTKTRGLDRHGRRAQRLWTISSTNSCRDLLRARSRLALAHRWFVAIGHERVQEELCTSPASTCDSCWSSTDLEDLGRQIRKPQPV